MRAAEANLRFLPDQVDYNRCWPGSPHPDSPTARMMQRVFDIARALPLFAAIDIHNNTGRNPHYACITDPSPVNCNLAARFNHVGMVFNHPGVSTRSFNGICPAATLECGLPGDPDGIRHAIRFVDELLHLDQLPDDMPGREQLHLVESHLSVQIPEAVDYAFDLHAEADLCFPPDFEDRNFTLFDPHEPFAYTRVGRPLQVLDAEERDLTDEFLRVEDGKVFLNHIMMPAMITRDRMVIRQDCLCHLMQDYLAHQE